MFKNIFLRFILLTLTALIINSSSLANDATVIIKDLVKLQDKISKAQLAGDNTSLLIDSIEFEKLAQSQNEPLIKLDSQRNLAIAYTNLGEFEQALKHYQQALELYLPSFGSEKELKLYLALTKLYIELNLIQQGLDLVNIAIKKAIAAKNLSMTVALNINKAYFLSSQGDLDGALILAQQGAEFYQSRSNHNYIAARNNIGMYYKEQKKYDLSLTVFHDLLKIARDINDSKYTVYTLLELGDINRILNHYDTARAFLLAALTTAKKADNKIWLQYCFSYLSALEKDSGNLLASIKYLKKSHRLDRKMFSKKALQQSKQTQTSIAVLQKKNEIALLEKDHKITAVKLKQTQLIVIIVAIATVLLLIALWFVRYLYLAQTRANQLLKSFQADISHELRTPLAVIKSNIGAFIDGIREPNTEAFIRLDNRINDLNRLISDLFDLSKNQNDPLISKKSDVCLNENLTDIIESFKSSFAEKELTIEADIQLTAPFIMHADPERLSQLFTNLMANSQRYTNGGGQLKVTAKTEKNNVIILFQDSHPGVATKDLKFLFDQLYRGESSRNRNTGGAGLGLTICRNIVKKHGGKITANHSSLGGLEVKITFFRKTN